MAYIYISLENTIMIYIKWRFIYIY